jgi:hypothetical protein
MDEAKRDQAATEALYETPRVVVSLDALDLVADADGVGSIRCGSSATLCP